MRESLSLPDRSSELVARVAMRVRKLRKDKAFSRRVLSEKSGVSPRYLAQLEAGQGNVSIVLLERIAAALDVKSESLLAENDAWDRDLHRIALLYRQAPHAVKQQVRSLLAAQKPAALRAGRICLVGLRGAGKSTLGHRVGKALGLPFIELNAEIEKQTGMPMSEVLALYGQDGYRTLEAEAVTRVRDQHDRLILAVAGGIASEEKTFAHLLEHFHTIWLRTTPAEHMQRVRAQGDLRPMEGNPAAMDQLKALLEARNPLYERASAQVNTSNRTVAESLNDVLAIIANKHFLDVARS